ncbi:S-methyl-5-thioribose-1-phosphate isomerase, partial [Pseudomonas syringae pv. actinidiae]|nr:S-methyl-5-thioribose-1-phosphate isomerase [Pseudomonas syringae pv. actinidiae]
MVSGFDAGFGCQDGVGDARSTVGCREVKAIDWRDDALYLLDQRVLPFEEVWHRYTTAAGVAEAIRTMVVRGAPAIGISAAYGAVLGARARIADGGDWYPALEEDMQLLADSRPTAVNLFWALNRIRDRLMRVKNGDNPLAALEAEAVAIHLSDREANLTMAQLVPTDPQASGNLQTVLTHCNTGALATGGFGTALGVIRAAHLEGMIERVYADETRPWLQGSRLTAWELANEGIPVTLNADSAAAHLMRTKGITWVIVGADRITANGDV